jgi:hypothetical protein
LSSSGPPAAGTNITCAPGRDEPSPLEITVPVTAVFGATRAVKQKEKKSRKLYLIIINLFMLQIKGVKTWLRNIFNEYPYFINQYKLSFLMFY